MSNQPEYIDYLSFFEAEPEILNPEVGWLYGAKFTSLRGVDRIIAVIAPGDEGFTFKWWQGQVLRADFNLAGVSEWQIESSPQREVLVLRFHQTAIGYFSLQLKPSISFTWLTQYA